MEEQIEDLKKLILLLSIERYALEVEKGNLQMLHTQNVVLFKLHYQPIKTHTSNMPITVSTKVEMAQFFL